MNGVNHILGRGLSKSTSRLAADSNQRSKKVNIDYTNRGVQTLPRKSKKQVNAFFPILFWQYRNLLMKFKNYVHVSVVPNFLHSLEKSVQYKFLLIALVENQYLV